MVRVIAARKAMLRPSRPRKGMKGPARRSASKPSNRPSNRNMDESRLSSEDMVELQESTIGLNSNTGGATASAMKTQTKVKRACNKRKDVEDPSDNEYDPAEQGGLVKKSKNPKKGVKSSALPMQTTETEKTNVKFKGVPQNGRHKGRQLVFWSENHKEHLLLQIQFHLVQMGVTIPWSEIANQMFPEKETSGQAIIQMLSKARKKILNRGGWVPPLPGRVGDKDIKKKNANIRGHLGKIGGKGAYLREIAWNEDTSMLWEERDIEQRNHGICGPRLIPGMPNRKMVSDSSPAGVEDEDQEDASDYDNTGFSEGPVGNKKSNFKKLSSHPFGSVKSTNDNYGDNFGAYEGPGAKKKSVIKKGKGPAGKSRKMKSGFHEFAQDLDSELEDGGVMTFLENEDEMSYASDDDLESAESSVDEQEEGLILKNKPNTFGLAAFSSENNEENYGNFPTNYHLTGQMGNFQTGVPSGDRARFPSGNGYVQYATKNEEINSGGFENGQKMLPVDAHWATNMYPRYGIDDSNAMFDEADYMPNGANVLFDGAENALAIKNIKSDNFDAVMNSQNKFHAGYQNIALPSIENSQYGSGNHGNIGFFDQDEFMGIDENEKVEEGFSANVFIASDYPRIQKAQKSLNEQKQMPSQQMVANTNFNKFYERGPWYDEFNKLIPESARTCRADGVPILGADFMDNAAPDGGHMYQYKHFPSGEIRWFYMKKDA